ncbi:MAG: hypothetical protein IJS37_03260 [Bacilli bacterium]|nr:hypothetical protein [Bacilli bacterium]
MKKKTLLLLFILGSLLASCGGGSSGKKNCDGGTCKIGYLVKPESESSVKIIR